MYYFEYRSFSYDRFTYRPYGWYKDGNCDIHCAADFACGPIIVSLIRETLTASISTSCDTVLRGRHRGSAIITAIADMAAASRLNHYEGAMVNASAESDVVDHLMVLEGATLPVSGYVESAEMVNAFGKSAISLFGNVDSRELLTHRVASLVGAAADIEAGTMVISRNGGIIRCAARVSNTQAVLRRSVLGRSGAYGSVSCEGKATTVKWGQAQLVASGYAHASTVLNHYAHSLLSVLSGFGCKERLHKYARLRVEAQGHMASSELVNVYESPHLSISSDTSMDSRLTHFSKGFIQAGATSVSMREVVRLYESADQISGSARAEMDALNLLLAALSQDAVTFFNFGGLCYFLDGNSYYYYDGVTAGQVTDIAYVPTVVKSKEPDGTGGYSYEELNLLSDSWKEEFVGKQGVDAFVLSMEADSVKCWLDGEPVDESGFIFPTDGTDYDRVTFTTAPDEGAIVTIQATKQGLGAPEMVTKCTIAQEWGGKNDTRVFFSGNPAISNRRWHSGLLDPTYFPVLAWDDIGSDAEAITGFGRLADYQIVYKERTTYYSSVEGPDADGRMSFPVLPMNSEYGCVSPRTVQPAQGGLLALSDRGVTFTVPSFVRGQLNVLMVSDNVNRSQWLQYGILDGQPESRRSAHSYIYDEKYYLHLDGRVWVLDLRHSNLVEGLACWYPFEGIPGEAACFFDKGNELYAGCRDDCGMVYRRIRGHYADGDAGVDAWWTSPLLFMDARGWLKKFTRLKLTFRADQVSDHILTFITDMGSEDILIRQDSGIFSYVNHSYANWTYGTWNQEYPSTQSEKIGHKGEYIQFKIRNDTNRGMAMMSAVVDYKMKKEVK